MYAKIFYNILTLTRFARITDKNILMKFNMYEKKLVIFSIWVFQSQLCISNAFRTMLQACHDGRQEHPCEAQHVGNETRFFFFNTRVVKVFFVSVMH